MNDWILASEKIPEDETRVLTFAEYPVYGKEVHIKRGITGGYYCHFRNKWITDIFIGSRVIAWKPFPKEPEGV